MNRREFLEKFVALGSASLILSACSQKKKGYVGSPIVAESKKGKDEFIAVYGPPPLPPEPQNEEIKGIK